MFPAHHTVSAPSSPTATSHLSLHQHQSQPLLPPQPQPQPQAEAQAQPQPRPQPLPQPKPEDLDLDPNQPPSPYRDKGKSRALPPPLDQADTQLYYRRYRSEEEDLEGMMRLVEEELSEPYNTYTFRYFLIEWPHLAFLVFPTPTSPIPIATILAKQDTHRGKTNRGYIAMLSVHSTFRRRGIAKRLVGMVIEEMRGCGAHEVVLETEYDNAPSLGLYDSIGFLREKRLFRFYSNGKDAFRLILPLPSPTPKPPETEEEAEEGRWQVASGPEWLEAGVPPPEEQGRYGWDGQGMDGMNGFTDFGFGPGLGHGENNERIRSADAERLELERRAGTPRPGPGSGGGGWDELYT